jgi:hypothetical protein
MCNKDKYSGVVLCPTHSTSYKFLNGIVETNPKIEKEDLKRSHKKRIQEIPLNMGQAKAAGHGGRGGNGGRNGCGRGGRGRSTLATVPCKASDQGACKDLKGHIFTIGSGNKGKDRDMLWTSKEKMATYIGIKFGDNAAQEWSSKKQIALKEPAYSQYILDRHGERVKAIKDQIILKLASLRAERAAIDDKIKASPTDCKLITEKQEIEDQILQCEGQGQHEAGRGQEDVAQ